MRCGIGAVGGFLSMRGFTMCFVHDGVSSDFLTVRYPKTRKPHTCDECFRAIPAGELAEYVSQKFEGELLANYYCGECEATRFRIHLMELAEGCNGAETWCPRGDLGEYCRQHEIKRSTHQGGQLYLRRKKRRQLVAR